jgi:hypothetical protein
MKDLPPVPLKWTPVMDSIVDSSLWMEPYFVRVLFVSMLAMKDRDMVVRRSAFAISRRANMTEQEVLDGIKILSEPDEKRAEPQPFEGRRIQKVEDGYLILNGAYYRRLISKEKRRADKTAWQAKDRAAEKNVGLPLVGEEAHVRYGTPDPVVAELEERRAPGAPTAPVKPVDDGIGRPVVFTSTGGVVK